MKQKINEFAVIAAKNIPFTVSNMILPPLGVGLGVGNFLEFSTTIWVLAGSLFLFYCLMFLAVVGMQKEIDVFDGEPARPIVRVSEEEIEQFLAMPMVVARIREIAQREARQFDEQKHIEDWGKFSMSQKI